MSFYCHLQSPKKLQTYDVCTVALGLSIDLFYACFYSIQEENTTESLNEVLTPLVKYFLFFLRLQAYWCR
jgi:hypothetical protein